MNKLFQLISDGDGAPSTMRFAVLLIIVPIMTVWTVLSIKAGQMIDLDVKWIGLIAAALAAKTGQSFSENMSTPPLNTVVLSRAPATAPDPAGHLVTVLLALGICAGLLFAGTGCKTVAPGQPSGALSTDTNGIVYIGSWQVKTNDVYTGIKIAATIGTQQGVKADTNSVAYFLVAEEVIAVALDNDEYDPALIQRSFDSISLNGVRDNPDVVNGVNMGLALYQAFFGQVVSQKIADCSPYLRPALAALHDGIAAGLPR